MSAHQPSDANGSGAALLEGKARREEPKPQGRSRVDIDPPGCETDFEIKGKSRYEASIVANRIFLKGDASPEEVERIVIEVNACDSSGDPFVRKSDGRPIPVARADLSSGESALFCEKCLAKKFPKRFAPYLDAKAPRSR